MSAAAGVLPVWDRPWPAEGLEAAPLCPACGNSGRRVLHDRLADLAFAAAPGRWAMWQCAACASAWLDPRPDPAHIGQAYSAYFTHEGEVPAEPPVRPGLWGLVRRAVLNGYINTRFGARFRPSLPFGALVLLPLPGLLRPIAEGYRHMRRLPRGGGQLLDVGCGNGTFLAQAARLGWQASGIDPDPAAIAVARRNGFDVQVGGIELFDGKAALFDQITLNHVIEHVHDPRGLVAACHRLLRPGGWLFIETPNIESAGHCRFGAAWRGLEAPRHLAVFSRAGLEQVLRAAGFARLRFLATSNAYAALAEESSAMALRGGLPLPEGPLAQPAGAGGQEFLSIIAIRR